MSSSFGHLKTLHSVSYCHSPVSSHSHTSVLTKIKGSTLQFSFAFPQEGSDSSIQNPTPYSIHWHCPLLKVRARTYLQKFTSLSTHCNHTSITSSNAYTEYALRSRAHVLRQCQFNSLLSFKLLPLQQPAGKHGHEILTSLFQPGFCVSSANLSHADRIR